MQAHGLAWQHNRVVRSRHFDISREQRTGARFTQLMATNDTTSDQNAKGQQIARMIPGVDGKLVFGFPQQVITKLRYVMQNANTHVSNIIAETQQMKMNSCFDPDSTGVGHQPWYFDEYAALYNNYRVIGSTLRVDFSPQSIDTTLNSGPWNIGIVGSAVSTNPSTSALDRCEMNDAVSDYINRDDGVVTMFWNYDPMEKLGQQANDDTVSALVTADPSQVYYANVWTAPFSSLATGNQVHYKITMEYTVEFFKLKKGVSS